MSIKPGFDSLADLVRCSICQKIFNDPWNLSCSHTFCKECIQDTMVQDDQGRKIQCPICDDFCHEEELRRNNLMEKLAARHRHTENKLKKCGLCQGDKPEWKCMDCDLVLCKSCQEQHSHEDAAENTVLALERENVASEPGVSCNLHTALMLDTFCKTCDKVVCPDCAEFDHNGHVIEEGDFAAERIMREVEDKLEIVDGRLGIVKDKVKVLDEYEIKLSDHVNSIRKQVKSVRDLLVSVIETDYNDTMQKVDTKTEEELQKAFTLKADLMFHLNNDTQITTMVRDCLKAHNGVAFLHNLTSNMKLKLDGAVNRDQKTSLATLHCLKVNFQPFDLMPDANLVGQVEFVKTPVEEPSLPPVAKKATLNSSKTSVASLKQFAAVPKETALIQLKSFSPSIAMYAERLWLPCPTENKIRMYNTKGKIEKTYACEEIKRPMSVVRLTTGDILVACDSNNGLVQLDAMGKFKRKIREGSFSQVTAVGSVIYALEYKLCRVMAYTFHGGRSWNEKYSWGLNYQNGNNSDCIYACEDSIYVSSWWNKGIYHYNGKGSLLAQYGGNQGDSQYGKPRRNSICVTASLQKPSTPSGSGLKRPRVSVADVDGCALITDTDGHCIYRLEGGQWHPLPIENCRSPCDLAVDEKNRCIWLLGEYGLKLQQLSY